MSQLNKTIAKLLAIGTILFITSEVLAASNPTMIKEGDGYTHYKQISVSNATNTTQTNYQMMLIVNKGSGPDSDSNVYLNNHALSWTGTTPNDIRFYKSDGITPLDYWIESSNDATAIVWIKFDSLPALATSTFYIYYGKSSETSASNGTNTFSFFDDFDGSSIDATKWTNTKTGGTITVSGGSVTLAGDIGAGKGLESVSTFGPGYTLDAWLTGQSSANLGYLQYGLGWYQDPGSNSFGAILDASDANTGLYGYAQNGSSPVGLGLQITTSAKSYIKRLGDGSTWSFSYNSDFESSITFTTSTSMKICIGAYHDGNTRTYSFQRVLVRKNAVTEPTFSTWGSEYKLQPPFTPLPIETRKTYLEQIVTVLQGVIKILSEMKDL